MNHNVKRLTIILLILCIITCCLAGCGGSAGDQTENKTDESEQSAAQWVQETEKQLETELGAFDITAHQREIAKTNDGGYPVLDAGRGNPNWINTQSRYAFTRFMNWAISESELTFQEGDMAGQVNKEGIGERFDAAMNPEDETDEFLITAVDYCTNKLGLDKDVLLKELADAVIGCYYPMPSRCLPCTETILNAYLQSVLYNGAALAEDTQVFPTEGGTAAMVYIFNSLSHNRLLNKGDRIAIATPIFTPYLQIPNVNDYDLVTVDVTASEDLNWDIPEKELAKLEDPSIKAFFLVNPSNPASHALSENSLERLVKIVEKNPDLIILTDDVYGTFAEDFRTVYSVLPHNTILVYSFSKLYGVTGWRVGLIAMNIDNICDRLTNRLSEEDKDKLRREYAIVSYDFEEMPFLERMVADSRSIGLYHTSGLSTPSQVFMDMMALTHLICEEEDPYIGLANRIVDDRYTTLMNAFGLPADESGQNARYYALVDINTISEARYGDEFADWLSEYRSGLDFLNDLAERKGVVLMYGPGFDAPEGTVRISLANLDSEDYVEIARRLYELLDEYYEEFEAETALDQAA